MEQINSVLSGIIMPALLLSAGFIFAARLRFFFILHPVSFCKTFKEAASGGGISPARALTQALAGTLGVGNMAGVATAICSGGSGSVIWMIISAFAAMSVKYTEVSLGVLHRRKNREGYFGGAMYYIKDIFGRYFPKGAAFLGGFFALLCLTNTLITGNIVQMKASAQVFPSFPPLILGGIVAAAAFIVAVGRASKVSGVTFFLIPFLSAGYIIICLFVICKNSQMLPHVLSNMVKSAFSLEAAAGGTWGYAVSRAIRFGVTRGIFSNEAGLGSSPSAHSAADTKSAHHQGCFGIFEVFADTAVLCTLTALVILLSDGVGKYDGIPLTLYAFSSLAGPVFGKLVGISVILFAFATVICNIQYGKVAIGYFSNSPVFFGVYYFLSAAATVFGCVINASFMWQIADLCVSLMTSVNVICLFFGFSRVKSAAKEQNRADLYKNS